MTVFSSCRRFATGEFVLLAVICAGLAGAAPPVASDRPVALATPIADHGTPQPAFAKSTDRDLYIVGFKQAALADFRGPVGTLGEVTEDVGGRLDVASAPARAYVAQLDAAQQQIVARAERVLGRSVQVRDSFQHALNAVVIEASAEEAARLLAMPEVAFVEVNEMLELDTDQGPTLIGTPNVWDGSGTPNNVPTRGEGVVLGIIDSGINFDSLSFQEIEPFPSGFVHTNPFGSGTYVGTCAPGGVDEGNCSAKVIGAYDFVYDVCVSGACGGPTGFIEEPSAEDNNGHGTHTASTAGGVAVAAPFAGAMRNISGVAPHANIIAYDACFVRASDGAGLCPSVSTAASVNQAVADGVVDVIGYSIGGGAQPWNDSVSLAFLGAHNAGILVSASAGNSGPGAGTLGHVEPWTITVAASTHNRSGFVNEIDILPQDGDPPLLDQRGDLGAAGTPLVADINARIVLSPAFAANPIVGNDGCNDGAGISPYTAGQFTGQVVIIRRGTCGFSVKADNAETAGAIAVILANNQGATTPLHSRRDRGFSC